MDDEGKRLIAQVQSELLALTIIVNEALSITLSHETDPHQSASLARREVTKILDDTEKKALEAEGDATRKEFRKWFFGLARISLKGHLDSIEKRVSTLTRNQPIH
jgi:hypothetical protein